MSIPGALIERNLRGQIVRSRGLTEQQRMFVKAYVAKGGKKSAAALEAGYASPRTAAYQLLQLPHVLAAIRDEQTRLIQTEGASLAVSVLLSVMRDPRDDKDFTRLKVDAAKTMLDRAGHIAPKAQESEPDQDTKPMSLWSRQDLEAFIARQTAAIELQARPIIDVDAAPIDAPDGQSIDPNPFKTINIPANS